MNEAGKCEAGGVRECGECGVRAGARRGCAGGLGERRSVPIAARKPSRGSASMTAAAASGPSARAAAVASAAAAVEIAALSACRCVKEWCEQTVS